MGSGLRSLIVPPSVATLAIKVHVDLAGRLVQQWLSMIDVALRLVTSHFFPQRTPQPIAAFCIVLPWVAMADILELPGTGSKVQELLLVEAMK